MKNKKTSDGRYRSKVYLGNGKYKYLSASSNKELAEKVNEIKLLLGKGLDISAAERDTFGDWSKRLLQKKKLSISKSRYDIYTYRIRDLQKFQNVPISQIRTADIQDIIYEMAAQGYSHSVLSDVKNTARQIFALAITNRVLDFNPADALDIPKCAKPEERRALTEQEQDWITAPSACRAHRAAMIMLYAGLRRGEVIPLLWSDVDLENNAITVNKAVEMIDGKSVLKDSTKTEAGMRTVYIPQILSDFLKKEDRQNNMLVCPSAKGAMMSESSFKRAWESYMADLNVRFGDFSGVLVPSESDPTKLTQYVPPKSRYSPKKVPMVIDKITPHMLRHTFITLMYFAGVDILTAKEQAGHADVQTTMGIYTHLDAKYKKHQVNKLDDYLSAKNTNGSQMGAKSG